MRKEGSRHITAEHYQPQSCCQGKIFRPNMCLCFAIIPTEPILTLKTPPLSCPRQNLFPYWSCTSIFNHSQVPFHENFLGSVDNKSPGCRLGNFCFFRSKNCKDLLGFLPVLLKGHTSMECFYLRVEAPYSGVF